MNTKKQYSLEERRKIVGILYGKYKEQYPQYEKNYLMPPPKGPPSLEKVDISNKQMSKVPITDLKKSVLCGTCLGDSSLRIQPKYKNARIQCRHSSRQAAWFFWKWTFCLKEYITEPESIQFQNPDGYQEKSIEKAGDYLGKLKVVTKAHPNLTALHSIICKKNRETIERSWLNHMTDYFLMTVWLDDGSLFNKRQGVICLDSSPLDQQKVLVDYLKTVWGIDSYCSDMKMKMSNGQQLYRIKIKDINSLLKLLRIVAPIIPVKEMLYKIMFVPFNDTDLLKRWASEVLELVLPEFREYIKEEYRLIIANYDNKQNSEDDIVQI